MHRSADFNSFSRQYLNRLISCLAVAAIAGASPVTFAQSSLLEEVIVTAQKREESQQDVGIAITAFTGEQLKAFGFINNTEVAAFTPGVFISGNNGGHTQQFTIRGATQNDFADIAEAPNAVYVDEAYQATGQSQLFANYDMERVEILKGPQGTLFGRNATGGLVHYITKRPTQEHEAYADFTYGSYDSKRFEGAISGGLSERVSARVSAFYSGHDDVMDNKFTDADLPATPGALAAFGRGPLTSNPDNHDDLWTDDQWSVRGQLLFEMNEDVEFLFKATYAQSKPASGPYQEVATVAFVDDTDGDGVEDQTVDTAFQRDLRTTCENISVNTGLCVNSIFDADFDGLRPNDQGDFFGAFEPDGTEGLDVITDHTTNDNDRTKIYGFSGKLNWDLGFAELVSVTSYSKQTKRQSLDVDSGPAPQFIVMNQSEFDWFSQELRLEGEAERFRWITGLYYLNIDGKYAQGLADTIGGINIFGGLFFGPVFNGIDLITGTPTAGTFLEGTLNAELNTDSYSFFGQIDYDLTEQLVFELGFRGIVEEKDYTYNSRIYHNTRDSRTDGALFAGAAPLGVIFDPTTPVEFLPPFADKTSNFLWSGKVQLSYSPNDDLMIYGGVNRGVKAGSFNAPLLTFLVQDDYGYDEEILLAYEIGFKSTLLDGKARLNMSAYYYDYTDYQVFQFVGTSGAVFNQDAIYKGFEAELYMNPVDNLDMIFGIGYIDAKVKDVLVAPNTPRDVEPTFTPEVQFNAMGRYTWPEILMGGNVALQIDGNYASSAFHNINNFGSHKMDSYWIGNARVSWISADEHWEIGGFVNNFSDTRNENIGFELSAICGCDEQSFGKPRWAGVNVRYNYF